MIQSTEIKGARVFYGFNPKNRNEGIQIYSVSVHEVNIAPWLEAMESGEVVLEELTEIIRKELES